MKKFLVAAALIALASFAMAPAAWAEGNMRKVGIVSFFSLDRSPKKVGTKPFHIEVSR